MKRFFSLIILLVLFSSGLFAKAKYSAFTQSFLARIGSARAAQQKTGGLLILSDAFRRQFLVKTAPDGDVVHGMMQVVESAINSADLERLGVVVNSKAGDIWTLVIPVASLETLGNLDGITYISIDSPVKKKLDAAREETRVGLANSGLNLPGAFSGANVVVGVIDGGFDLLHPAFQDDAGSLRIARVWDQSGSGTAPAGFSYGAESSGSAAISTLGQTGDGSHGAHVAATAAGSGRNTPNKQYKGVAHQAELVLVELGGGASAVADAAKYIFDYAASVGKPAVINMSLGSHIGPHDGTSLQDQAFNSLVGSGKILVGAAGNEGSTPLHLAYNFAPSGETMATIVQFEGADPQTGSGAIDIWGSPDSNFAVGLKVFDASANLLGETEFFRASADQTFQGALSIGPESITYQIAAVAASATNRRPNVLVQIDNPTVQFVALFVSGAGTTVHLWNHGKGTGAALAGGGPFRAGDSDYTVGEIGGTAAGVITVGAYTTKNVYTNSTGQSVAIPFSVQLGEIAPFSSLGPTLDGRVKPDITAPGNVVISAVQATDQGYNDGGSKRDELVIDADNSSTGRYASQQGTSMATPMTTGVIALMLQALPSLTPEQIRSIFDRTARSDAQTGTIPSGGNNRWGRGKIDAYAALTQGLSTALSPDPYSVPSGLPISKLDSPVPAP